jgi:hypothetical protein
MAKQASTITGRTPTEDDEAVDGSADVDEAAPQQEIYIIEDAIQYKIQTWEDVFPQPPPDKLKWCGNFSLEQRSKMRQFIKPKLKECDKLATPSHLSGDRQRHKERNPVCFLHVRVGVYLTSYAEMRPTF